MRKKRQLRKKKIIGVNYVRLLGSPSKVNRTHRKRHHRKRRRTSATFSLLRNSLKFSVSAMESVWPPPPNAVRKITGQWSKHPGQVYWSVPVNPSIRNGPLSYFAWEDETLRKQEQFQPDKSLAPISVQGFSASGPPPFPPPLSGGSTCPVTKVQGCGGGVSYVPTQSEIRDFTCSCGKKWTIYVE